MFYSQLFFYILQCRFAQNLINSHHLNTNQWCFSSLTQQHPRNDQEHHSNAPATPWQPPTKPQHLAETLICLDLIQHWPTLIGVVLSLYLGNALGTTQNTLAAVQQCSGNHQQHSSIVAGTLAQVITITFSLENLKINLD